MDESPAITDDSIKVIESTLQTLTDASKTKLMMPKVLKML